MWIVLGVSVVLMGTGTAAAANCHTVAGSFRAKPVAPPDCTSPIGICYAGRFKGSIQGKSFFTGTSLVPTIDSPTTGVVLLTGDTTITSRAGEVFTKDAVVLATTDDGDFAEVDTIVGGTGVYDGVSGRVTATGATTPDGGLEGVYTGTVCRP